jgi:hypothetical protein
MSRKLGNASKTADNDLDSTPMTRAEMRRGVMGRYARTPGSALRFVELDRDVAGSFHDSETVNEALRMMLKHRDFSTGKRRKST